MSQGDMRRGWLLRLYLGLSHLFPLIAKQILQKRLTRGKEHPTRWPEKLGQNLAPRPAGPLIWLHAVGLGEVLSLRGLIDRLTAQNSDLSFLVTSTTLASAQVFAKNLPPRTLHQFLPIDAPTYRRRFLDHFQPDLCIWAEQDIWPGLVSDTAQRGIPQAVIAARMNAKSFRSHRRARSLYSDLYRAMALITAQDQATAQHIETLGAAGPIRITGSLKPAAPALTHDASETLSLSQALAGRMIWAVAPSHGADEHISIAAHTQLQQTHPDALLIIAPRFPERRDDILSTLGHQPPLRSQGQVPGPQDSIWICDTFGDLGLIYRLCQAVLIGGTFSDIEGHNPWEAAALDTAILHGPRTANFKTDFEQLGQDNGAIKVTDADTLAHALSSADLNTTAQNATKTIQKASHATDQLSTDLLQLLEQRRG